MAFFVGANVLLDVMQSNGTTLDFSFAAFTNDPQLTENVAAADTSVLGTTAKTFIPARSDAKFSFKVFYDTTHSGSPQEKLWALRYTTRVWRLRPLGTASTKPEVSFSGFWTSLKESFANNDQAIGADIEIQVTGAITRGAQA